MARSFALKEETEAFAAQVAGLVTPRRRPGWLDQVARLWADVQARGLAARTDATRKLYASRFRSAVRAALAEAVANPARRAEVEAEVLGVVRLDRAVVARLHEDYQARVRSSNADLVVIPAWREVVQALQAMLGGRTEVGGAADAEARALALMGLTGRRFAEVLKAGSLAPRLERTARGVLRHRWLVDFTGQLKTGGGPLTMAGQTFPIPTLAPADEVLTAFQALRASPEGQAWAASTDRALSTTINPRLNRALLASPVARHWPPGLGLTLRDLRTLYAEVAYANFAPRTTRAPYFARILGHREDDLTTALSYMRFSLSQQSLRNGQEEMNRLTLLRSRRQAATQAETGKGEAHETAHEAAHEAEEAKQEGGPDHTARRGPGDEGEEA